MFPIFSPFFTGQLSRCCRSSEYIEKIDPEIRITNEINIAGEKKKHIKNNFLLILEIIAVFEILYICTIPTIKTVIIAESMRIDIQA